MSSRVKTFKGMQNNPGEIKETELENALRQAFGTECIFRSPKVERNGPKELADIVVLTPPYAVVFQCKWRKFSADDLVGENSTVVCKRLEQTMIDAAGQFREFLRNRDSNVSINFPALFKQSPSTSFQYKLSDLKEIIPVVVVDFDDPHYDETGGRYCVKPVVVGKSDSVRKLGPAHCFLLRDLKLMLQDMFTVGDFATYLLLRSRQLSRLEKFCDYSELDMFAVYLTKYDVWKDMYDSDFVGVERNFYEARVVQKCDEFRERRLKYRMPDGMDFLIDSMRKKAASGLMVGTDVVASLHCISRVKLMPVMVKKEVSRKMYDNLNALKMSNPSVGMRLSVGRFPGELSGHSVYCIVALRASKAQLLGILEYLYYRMLSYVYDNGWSDDVEEIFFIVADEALSFAYTAIRPICKGDYANRLSAEDIESTRSQYSFERVKDTEWSYMKRL